jgi:LysM repeat protein
MKILRIFGVVVGIHVAALVLIFANPGCSSPNKQKPTAADTAPKNDGASTAPTSTSDNVTPVTIAGGAESPVSAVPSNFDPNATATPSIRFSPTRPGTPTASALETQPVNDVIPASTYTVVKGDSLWTIARKNHLSIAEVAAANNMKSTTPVRVGQKLIIPAKSNPAPSVTGPVETAATKPPVANAPAPRGGRGASVKHTVKPGETLGAIARKYQVKVGEIATANNISDPAKIRPGMELVIPGWQAPAGKSKSSTAKAPASTPAPTPVQTTPEPAQITPSTPSLVIPAPEDNTVTPAPAEPPVIKIDDKR